MVSNTFKIHSSFRILSLRGAVLAVYEIDPTIRLYFLASVQRHKRITFLRTRHHCRFGTNTTTLIFQKGKQYENYHRNSEVV